MSLSRPLELEKTLQPLERRLDPVPLIDVLLLTLLFSFLGSRFIFAPGLSMELNMELPLSADAQLPGILTDDTLTVAVLTAKQSNLHLFDGRIFTLYDLEAHFRNNPVAEERQGQAVLLVKMHKDVSMQTFVQIAEMARKAGYGRVQVAAATPPVTEEAGNVLNLPPAR